MPKSKPYLAAHGSSRSPNMYSLSRKQWNPFVGCRFQCVYCEKSFQQMLKRWGSQHCNKCYNYVPHSHPERLTMPLPQTRYMQFIFTCSSGDIAFCPKPTWQAIKNRIAREQTKTFLIQSKNPIVFQQEFTPNVLLGTTLETNKTNFTWLPFKLSTYHQISNAPHPSRRYLDFLEVNHTPKMVTIEPVLDFDLDIMVKWIRDIEPAIVWLGYDTKNNQLPEPPLTKVTDLYDQLTHEGYLVLLKKIRPAWYENDNDDLRI